MRATFLAVLLFVGSGALAAQPDNVLWDGTLHNQSRANEDALIKPLQTALNTGGYVGRLYFQAACNPRISEYDIRFPDFAARTPKGRGVRAVRSVFSSSAPVTVIEDEGIARITLGTVPRAILNTRIRRLTLTPIDQYNAIMAIAAIQSAPEFRAAMDELGVRTPVTTLSYPMQMPAPGLPHLPEILTDITVDRALDEVARTFGGVVLFGACGRVFFITNWESNVL